MKSRKKLPSMGTPRVTQSHQNCSISINHKVRKSLFTPHISSRFFSLIPNSFGMKYDYPLIFLDTNTLLHNPNGKTLKERDRWLPVICELNNIHFTQQQSFRSENNTGTIKNIYTCEMIEKEWRKSVCLIRQLFSLLICKKNKK